MLISGFITVVASNLKSLLEFEFDFEFVADAEGEEEKVVGIGCGKLEDERVEEKVSSWSAALQGM